MGRGKNVMAVCLLSRHYGISRGSKRVTTSLKCAKTICLSIPSGLGTTLENFIFFAPGTLVESTLTPVLDLQSLEIALKMKCPCCERQIPQVVRCVLKLCTRFFHQTVHGDQTVHAVSARSRKTRRYTKVVCCVLMIHSHTRVGPAIIGNCLENQVSML